MRSSPQIETLPPRPPLSAPTTAPPPTAACPARNGILLLQEIRDWESAEILCSVVPNLAVQIASKFPRPQNLVIASKFPADSAWFAEWQNTLGNDGPPRGYAFAAIPMPNGMYLMTYCVHLKSNVGGVEDNIPIREESSKQLLAHAKEIFPLYQARKPCLLLVGGDFNSSVDGGDFRKDKTLKPFQEFSISWVFEGVQKSKRVTIPASGRYPANTFDHIFFGGMKLKSVEVLDGSAASDHNPVLAIFSL